MRESLAETGEVGGRIRKFQEKNATTLKEKRMNCIKKGDRAAGRI